MSPHLNDAELELVFAAAKGPRKKMWQNEKDLRESSALYRKLAGRGGTCGHGLRVYIDNNGAYSSGYVCHARSGPGISNICGNGGGVSVKWDPWTPEQLEVRKRLAVLRRRRERFNRAHRIGAR